MRALLLFLALVPACSESSEPPLSDATSLVCPTPGTLPFRLVSSGYQKPVNQTLVADNPRNKDQSSDTLGNPGGARATVFLADDQAPAASQVIDYRGIKARTSAGGGLQSMPLTGETVSLWHYDTTTKAWSSLDAGQTDSNGQYDLSRSNLVPPNGDPVYAMLEADGSCAAHYGYLLPAGAKVVVSDIDGTLTADDGELVKQVTDINYVPILKGAADQLLKAWAAKGYPIIYLTARPHLLRPDSRLWLEAKGFPPGPLITANGGKTDDVYKTLWMNRLIQTFGWNVVAAYGNADTDITAYLNAGISTSRLFIVGPLAGTRGTTAIENNDFTQHINTFVAAQPTNQ